MCLREFTARPPARRRARFTIRKRGWPDVDRPSACSRYRDTTVVDEYLGGVGKAKRESKSTMGIYIYIKRIILGILGGGGETERGGEVGEGSGRSVISRS